MEIEKTQTQEKQTQEKQEKKSKRILIVRLIIYITFGLILPVLFLILRFNLFSTTTKMTFGGWGIVASVLVAVFMVGLAKQAEEVFDGGIEAQCIRAFRKIFVPLLTVTLCLWGVKDFIDELIQFFIVITICETVSYIANPMYEYVRKNKEAKEENKIMKMAKIFWNSKE